MERAEGALRITAARNPRRLSACCCWLGSARHARAARAALMASAVFEGTSLVNMYVRGCWVNGIRRLVVNRRGDEEEFFEIRTEWSDRNVLYLHRSYSDLGRLFKRLLDSFPEDRPELSQSPLLQGWPRRSRAPQPPRPPPATCPERARKLLAMHPNQAALLPSTETALGPGVGRNFGTPIPGSCCLWVGQEQKGGLLNMGRVPSVAGGVGLLAVEQKKRVSKSMGGGNTFAKPRGFHWN